MAANWTAFVAGNVLTAAQLNGLVDNFADLAIFNETQASGTNGGTFTSGSYVKRTLNTTAVNNITGCSIASSVITLPAGTYEVHAHAPVLAVDRHKLRVRDTTNSADLVLGSVQYASSGNSVTNRALVDGTFTLAGSTNIELQHRCQTTAATAGLGAATSFGDSEIFAVIMLRRVA